MLAGSSLGRRSGFLEVGADPDRCAVDIVRDSAGFALEAPVADRGVEAAASAKESQNFIRSKKKPDKQGANGDKSLKKHNNNSNASSPQKLRAKFRYNMGMKS